MNQILRTRLVLTLTVALLVWGRDSVSAQNQSPVWTRLRLQQASRVVVVQGTEHRLWVDGKELSPKTKESTTGSNDAVLDGEWLQISLLTAKEIRIQQPRLLELQLKGAVSVQSQGTLREDLLRVGLSGVGQVALGLEVGEMLADLNGVGRMEFHGQADRIRLEINGPGLVEARQLKVRKAQVFIDGLGLCRLDVSDTLLADISGGGSIRYRKEPPTLLNRINGLGSVAAWDYEEGGGPTRADGAKGDFWSGRAVKEPKNPAFELGFAHWMHRGRYAGAPATDPELRLEPEKSLFMQWWTPLRFQEPLLGVQKNGTVSSKGSLWIRGGMVLHYHNLRLEDNLMLTKNNGRLSVVTLDSNTGTSFGRSNFENMHLMFPVGFSFVQGSRPTKGWHAGIMAMPGLRLWSRTLNRYRDPGGQVLLYRTGNFYQNPFSLSIRSEIGKGNWRFFGQYSIYSMFRGGLGPDLNRLDWGITLWGY
ncbi:MAG: GIN domain-containing protein [Bacteroidota bacterium]